jgi:leader peptidase (prepilin peptidase)/N-methyltransferase
MALADPVLSIALLAIAFVAGCAVGLPIAIAAERLARSPLTLDWQARLATCLANGTLFAIIWWAIGWRLELAAYLVLAVASVVLAVVDLAEKRIPNSVVLPASALVALLLLAAVTVTGEWQQLFGALLGSIGLFAIYLVLALVSPRGMGMGDVKLALLLGLGSGYLGWTPWLVCLLGGFVVGGIAALVALAAKRVSRTESIPFGPSMVAGFALAILLS